MAITRKRNKSSDLKKQPSEAQLKARAKFAERAKLRAKGFEMTAKINDKIMVCKTNDLAEAIESLGQEIKNIKTRLILIIKKGGKQCDKILFVPQTKQLFRNKFYRNLFVRRLIFK